MEQFLRKSQNSGEITWTRVKRSNGNYGYVRTKNGRPIDFDEYTGKFKMYDLPDTNSNWTEASKAGASYGKIESIERRPDSHADYVAQQKMVDAQDEAHDLTPIFANLMTAGQAPVVNEGAENIKKGNYLLGASLIASPLMFGSGAIGTAARSGVGLYNLANENGVRKTINNFSKGNYGQGALSLLGDTFNAAMAAEGLGGISNALKGTSGYKNWRLAGETNLATKGKPNISITADTGTTTNQGSTALSLEEILKAFNQARQWHLNRINSPGYTQRALRAGFTEEEIPQLLQQLTSLINRLKLLTPEEVFGPNIRRNSNANGKAAAEYWKANVNGNLKQGIAFYDTNASYDDAVSNFIHEFGHGATFGLNGTETSGYMKALADQFPLINRAVKYNRSLYPEVTEETVRKVLPSAAKTGNLGYYAKPTEMLSRGYEFMRDYANNRFKAYKSGNLSSKTHQDLVGNRINSNIFNNIATPEGATNFYKNALGISVPLGLGYGLYSTNDLLQQLLSLKQGGKMNTLLFLKNGSKIHIKKKNRGKFTDYCGGEVTQECIRRAKASGNPTLVKRATFADNARKWKYGLGGNLFEDGGTKAGIPVDYLDPLEVMPLVANNPNKSIVLDEVVVTPSKKLPMQSDLFEGITNQAANEKADEHAKRVAPTAEDLFTIGTLGGLNNLSPTQWTRRAYDLGEVMKGNMSWGNFVNNWFYGNNGLVSDKYAQEHPYTSTAINLVGDVGSFGAFSALRKLPKYAALMLAENRAAQEATALNWRDMLANSTRRTKLGDVEVDNPGYGYRRVVAEEPSTSLKFFERPQSKISEAERAGIPKGERNLTISERDYPVGTAQLYVRRGAIARMDDNSRYASEMFKKGDSEKVYLDETIRIPDTFSPDGYQLRFKTKRNYYFSETDPYADNRLKGNWKNIINKYNDRKGDVLGKDLPKEFYDYLEQIKGTEIHPNFTNLKSENIVYPYKRPSLFGSKIGEIKANEILPKYVRDFRLYLGHLGYNTSNVSDHQILLLLTDLYKMLTKGMSGKTKGLIFWHEGPKYNEVFDFSHTGENTGNMGALGPGNYFSSGASAYGEVSQPYLITGIKETPIASLSMIDKGLIPAYISPSLFGVNVSGGGYFEYLHSSPEKRLTYPQEFRELYENALAKAKERVATTPVESSRLWIDPALIKNSGVAPRLSLTKIKPMEFMLRRNTGIKSLFPHPDLFVRDNSGKVILNRNWNDIRVNYKQGGKMNTVEQFKNGSKIHIKKKNRGKFTDYCGGLVTQECINRGKHSSNPAIRKRATFADNARRWKHKYGGFVTGVNVLDSNPRIYKYLTKIKVSPRGIVKKETGGSFVNNALNFINSDTGQSIIGGVSNIIQGMSAKKKLNKAIDALKKAIDELYNVAKNNIDMGARKSLAQANLEYKKALSPGIHFGEIDLGLEENKLKLEAAAKATNDANVLRDQALANLNNQAILMSNEVSNNITGNIGGLLNGAFQLAGNYFSNKTSSNSTTVKPGYTYSKIASNNFSVPKTNFSVNMKL